MNLEDVVLLEEALGTGLPHEYRQLLLNYPEEFEANFGGESLYSKAVDIEEATRELYSPRAIVERDLPPGCVVIGRFERKGHYFLNPQHSRQVLYVGLGEEEHEEQAASLAEYVRELRERALGWEVMEVITQEYPSLDLNDERLQLGMESLRRVLQFNDQNVITNSEAAAKETLDDLRSKLGDDYKEDPSPPSWTFYKP